MNMGNPFKKIFEEKELPDIIKEKVINDINLIRLSLDLSELFFVSIPEVAMDFLDQDASKERLTNEEALPESPASENNAPAHDDDASEEPFP